MVPEDATFPDRLVFFVDDLLGRLGIDSDKKPTPEAIALLQECLARANLCVARVEDRR